MSSVFQHELVVLVILHAFLSLSRRILADLSHFLSAIRVQNRGLRFLNNFTVIIEFLTLLHSLAHFFAVFDLACGHLLVIVA